MPPSALNPIHFRRFWWPPPPPSSADDQANQPLAAGQSVWLEDEPTVHYLATVLRCKVNESLLAVVPGDPAPWWATVLAVERRRLHVRLERPVDELPLHPPSPITLAMALIKDDPWEWTLQKATELGVARIVPLHTARCSAPFPPKPARLERWVSQLKAAALQSEGTGPPVLADPIGLADWLAPVAQGSGGPVLWLQERAEAVDPLAKWLSVHGRRPMAPITLVVGPEGGWTSDEQALMAAVGGVPVSLGPRVLRAETAALAALAQVMGTL